MWAVIGVYTGREDNIFWRRLPEEDSGQIEAAGAKSLGERDAEPLGRDIIHSVTNPLARLTGAIHVYGGDFFSVSRSEWDPETLLERHYDMEKNMPVRSGEPGLCQFVASAGNLRKELSGLDASPPRRYRLSLYRRRASTAHNRRQIVSEHYDDRDRIGARLMERFYFGYN